MSAGFIYAMTDGIRVKIGLSGDPDCRRFGVQADVKKPVKLAYKIAVDDMRSCEAAAHGKLASKRIKGEWFDVTIEEAIECLQWAAQNPLHIASANPNTISKAFRFTPEELALLEKLTTDGSYKDTVMKALRAMDAGKPITQDQVIDWIKRNTR